MTSQVDVDALELLDLNELWQFCSDEAAGQHPIIIGARDAKVIGWAVREIESLRAQLDQRSDALPAIRAQVALQERTAAEPEVLQIGVARYNQTGGNVGLSWHVEGNGVMPRDGEAVYVALSPAIQPEPAKYCQFDENTYTCKICGNVDGSLGKCIQPALVSKSDDAPVDIERWLRETKSFTTTVLRKGSMSQYDKVRCYQEADVRAYVATLTRTDCNECNDAGCMYCAEFAGASK